MAYRPGVFCGEPFIYPVFWCDNPKARQIVFWLDRVFRCAALDSGIALPGRIVIRIPGNRPVPVLGTSLFSFPCVSMALSFRTSFHHAYGLARRIAYPLRR